MQLIIFLSFLFLAAADVGVTDPPYWYTTYEVVKTTAPDWYSTTSTTPQPTKPQNPCGSHNSGDYRGNCDESVPVIVLPKGRPIMERVLDWFKCATESCHSVLPTAI